MFLVDFDFMAWVSLKEVAAQLVLDVAFPANSGDIVDAA